MSQQGDAATVGKYSWNHFKANQIFCVTNKYVNELKTTTERLPQQGESFQVVIHADKQPASAYSGRFNAPTCSEVAVVIVGQQFEKRDIILQSHDNKLQRISELHRSYETLQYPLMFCRGEDGYAFAESNCKTTSAKQNRICSEFLRIPHYDKTK